MGTPEAVGGFPGHAKRFRALETCRGRLLGCSATALLASVSFGGPGGHTTKLAPPDSVCVEGGGGSKNKGKRKGPQEWSTARWTVTIMSTGQTRSVGQRSTIQRRRGTKKGLKHALHVVSGRNINKIGFGNFHF